MRYLWALLLGLAPLIVVAGACSPTNPGTTFGGSAGMATATGGSGTTSTSSTTTTSDDGGFTFNDGSNMEAGCTAMKTCADEGANCGPIGDGCGGIIDCGTCTAPET